MKPTHTQMEFEGDLFSGLEEAELQRPNKLKAKTRYR